MSLFSLPAGPAYGNPPSQSQSQSPFLSSSSMSSLDTSPLSLPGAFAQGPNQPDNINAMPTNAVPVPVQDKKRKRGAPTKSKVSKSKGSTDGGQAPRKRTTRACDQCNHLRTKCNGQHPCAHCVGKYILLTVDLHSRLQLIQTWFTRVDANEIEFKLECEYLRVPLKRGKASQTYIESTKRAAAAAQAQAQAEAAAQAQATPPSHLHGSTLDNYDIPHHDPVPVPVSVSMDVPDDVEVDLLSTSTTIFPAPPNSLAPLLKPTTLTTLDTIPAHPTSTTTPSAVLYEPMSPSTGWLLNLVSASALDQQTPPLPPPPPPPEKLVTRPPHAQSGSPAYATAVPPQCRYPFLNPVLPLLVDVAADDALPVEFVEHLLEVFCQNESVYSLAPLLRRASVLSSTHPRRSSPALVLSCLLVAAPHSPHPLVSGSAYHREQLVARLMKLTLAHLTVTAHQVVPALAIAVDDAIAYIHLGTVASASEFKGSSLRFWCTAWILSKELRLGVERAELPEEVREERRRVWWLLYMVDRHLGLCYNRPLTILDSECKDLYRPMDEAVWAALGEDAVLVPAERDPKRRKGLCHEVTGESLFGFFLPLMTVLGSLLELHHLQQNPVVSPTALLAAMRTAIQAQLDQYTQSVHAYPPPSPSHQQSLSPAWRDYALQIAHVLHMLLLVPWDPLDLIEASPALVHSPDFTRAQRHALTAASHAREVLKADRDLTLMPFFYGIYLLQSSFLLLYMIDGRNEHGSSASEQVVEACEVLVRAHEVCVVTLDAEYQRNFRRVLRGTMGALLNSRRQAKKQGETHGETEEGRRRRREVLGLYRWSSGGRGIAV